MGWGRMLLLGNVGQQLDISDLQAEIEGLRQACVRPSAGVKGLESRLAQVEDELGELRLYVAVLLRLATSRGLVTGDELKQIVETLDVSDGTADGRFKGKAIE